MTLNYLIFFLLLNICSFGKLRKRTLLYYLIESWLRPSEIHLWKKRFSCSNRN